VQREGTSAAFSPDGGKEEKEGRKGGRERKEILS
jgi:hypothetical protein